MLVTIISVRERAGMSAQILAQEEEQVGVASIVRVKQRWLTPKLFATVGWTAAAALVAWGLMTLWNTLHLTAIQIPSDVQQVVLEVVATIGLLRIFDFNPRRDPDFA